MKRLSFLLLLAAASPAAAQAPAPLSARIAACAAAADHPACLLKAAAAADEGAVLGDDDLRAHPAVLALAGLATDADARWRAGGGLNPVMAGLSDATAAATASRALDAAGAPPARALAPIMALSNAPQPVPRLLGVAALPAPRLIAFSGLLQPSAARPLSPGLQGAALAAFEAEVRRTPDPGAATVLATAYARAGDEAGVQRALALEPDPAERVSILLELGRIDAAAALAASGSTPLRLAVIRSAVARGEAVRARPLADALLRTADDDAGRDYLRRAAGDLASAATPAVALAWVTAEEARLDRSLAERDASDVAGRIDAVAAGWRALGRRDRLETLIVRLKPVAAAEIARRDADPAAPTPAGTALGRLLLAQGRGDEASALRLVSPAERLRDDIDRGRGVGRLAGDLAAAGDERGRIDLVVACADESRRRKAFADLPACYAAWRGALIQPQQRQLTAGAALHDAGEAAEADDLRTARALLAFSVETEAMARAADPGLANHFGGAADAGAVVQVAKAELRADGRLPKSEASPPPASERTVIRPAP